MKIKLNTLFAGYELIDCGDLLKLERFGDVVLIRPEITAKDKPALLQSEWQKIANAEFIETSKNKGYWEIMKPIPEKWFVQYKNDKINLIAALSLTQSKHVGIFPEQVLNWNYIQNVSRDFDEMHFLNLFGYTGLTSIAAAHFAERITHIDSIKKVVEWTKTNAQNSGFNNLRCITEDAQKFVEREIKRGNRYHGVILDPPPIGVAANNTKWILEDMIEKLLSDVSKILHEHSFVIMNLYAQSIDESFIANLISTHFPYHKILFCEKVIGESKYGNTIDHGFFIRLEKQKLG